MDQVWKIQSMESENRFRCGVNPKWNVARFHVEFGPDSLFERIRFKMRSVTELKLHGTHFRLRESERRIPREVIEALENFKSDLWNVVSAEVRTDSGKFVSSTWCRNFGGKFILS